jgi:phenylalanyl-tRNA synthetase beta chain
MKLPLSWLKEYIDISLSANDIAELLTSSGIEVEGIDFSQIKFEGVVSAKVIDSVPHPDADKLTVNKIFDGTNEYQVVCGASNCKKGMHVALAKIGAQLTDKDMNTFKIKITKIRGVESFGMLCSEDELGLNPHSEGILELSQSIELGRDLKEIFQDPIFDITLTPNLIHCASVLGIARELSAIVGSEIKKPLIKFKESNLLNNNNLVQIEVKNKKLCPRYASILIQKVKVGPSPSWLKNRLEACGLRSINNVVDITNYVLLEFGHPLHAFDFSKIQNGKIFVETAIEGMTIKTLDGQTRQLNHHMLLVSDESKPLAIAGIMGGFDSQVDENTTDVLLEAAYFDPSNIRKTSKILNLSTQSSKHFERGQDPNQVIDSLKRAACLIEEIACGSIATSILDHQFQPFNKKTITLRLSRLNELLGLNLSLSEVDTILQKLECSITYEGLLSLHVQVPTYRGDILSEIDLIEEVARIYGYNNILKSKAQYTASQQSHAPFFLFEKKVREKLLREGLQEFLTCDLISPRLIELFHNDQISKEAVISVLNPTSQEQSKLRLSLLPGLIEVVKNNQNQQIHDIFGFEIGRVHFKHENQFKEHTNAAIVLSGKDRPHFWDGNDQEVDFFTLKGIIENVLDSLYFQKPYFRPLKLNTLHPLRQAAIFIEDRMVGAMGQVHPSLLRELDIQKSVLFAEIDLHDLFKAEKRQEKMNKLMQMPSICRDWTEPCRKELTVQTLLDFIETLSSSLLESVNIKSIYENTKLENSKKNVTLRFVYRDSNRTLSIQEVDDEHKRITKATSEFLNQL